MLSQYLPSNTSCSLSFNSAELFCALNCTLHLTSNPSRQASPFLFPLLKSGPSYSLTSFSLFQNSLSLGGELCFCQCSGLVLHCEFSFRRWPWQCCLLLPYRSSWQCQQLGWGCMQEGNEEEGSSEGGERMCVCLLGRDCDRNKSM